MSRRWLRVLRTPLGLTTAALVVAVVVLAIVAPVLWSDRAEVYDTDNILAGPSGDHWAGTDGLGRDIFFRALVASRLSLELALAATVIGVLAGLLLGTAPLLLGRRLGRLVTTGVNIAVAFPGLLLALFFAVIFGVGATGAVLAIGFALAPSFARLVQTLVAGVAALDYVSAARVAGVGRVRILLRHVLPNIAEPLVVNATIAGGGALLAFAGLSFLGLGVQQPSYDWGRLLFEGIGMIYVNPAAALAPGIAVLVAGLAFNLFGESVAKGLGVSAVGGVPVPATSSRLTGHAGRRDGTDGSTHMAMAPSDLVLDVVDLRVSFPGPAGPIRPVRGISFSVRHGEALGVVGESGSGKSLTALAVAQLIEEPGRVEADRLEFRGADLRDGPRAHRHLLGTSMAMVFQDPMTSFNPTRRMGSQLAEVAVHHQGMTRRQAMARAVDRLRAVRVPEPERRATQYPHEFSGGMRQRAMIGMGVMGNPSLIIADEPTTALDVTVQQQVLDLLQAIRDEDDVALVLISHDVTVVGEVCDRVLVMYAGRIVEDLPAHQLQGGALHPYTRALVAAVPDMRTDLDQPLAVVPGRPVDPSDVPTGCAFAARCPLADDHCRTVDPPLAPTPTGSQVACWHAGEPLELDEGTGELVEAKS
ncbi:peptide ABC transporter ATP-binding protein [Nocardioides szechwanensis]|uniref:Oligopeptide/dipeptide ABC transporter, ATP-binding protein, C-terminal domain-containing protein n=1 Tax=Nocardioides szechwanensis TaxID=1005944 RepID=A0A1G9Z842_9ACTN|nr:dipeptide/oligopeptide/nickel ABC transporter permease/ATP-binding protein [Nocardioides szechwanensis]GEP33852.1 peptide ABC transporter ATP-binding protein [Nocardioides szechwanensis]SDN17582.1 oligopeptide/dipeptide ABC transporter, ATP-binding protein, C-terminal domain-containing protein [Nocardioides szechwanensis]